MPRLLLIDEPARRSLHAEHLQMKITIDGKSERAPDDEGAPGIEQRFLAH
jgi:hypothetical protein